jgi:peptidoglycan/xylan/chitin deacetylase (PgdA/CDA1 family)
VRASEALRGAAAFLLLPLALVPVALAVPGITDGGGSDAAAREPLDAPHLEIPAGRLKHWRQLPVPAAGTKQGPGAVPVLAYHGVNGNRDHYSVSRRAFAGQMRMLGRAGFETIGIADYVRFLEGDTRGLPPRPVLITFDDGRLDSYRGADRILAEHGFRAVMFVIAGSVGQGRDFYLDWSELRRMATSGRWDVQAHAGVLHSNVPTDGHAGTGPAYAWRRWVAGSGLESFSEWRKRVAADVLWGTRALADRVPGFVPWSFAVPFGDYGQERTNDPRIPLFFRRFLLRHFKAVFLTRPPEYTTPRSPRAGLGRIEVHTDTTTDQLYRWLAARMPQAEKGG